MKEMTEVQKLKRRARLQFQTGCRKKATKTMQRALQMAQAEATERMRARIERLQREYGVG